MIWDYSQSIETDGPWLRSFQYRGQDIRRSSHIEASKTKILMIADELLSQALPQIIEPVLHIEERFESDVLSLVLTTDEHKISIFYNYTAHKFDTAVQTTKTVK